MNRNGDCPSGIVPMDEKVVASHDSLDGKTRLDQSPNDTLAIDRR
jgi:hypothetical protein